MGTNAEYLAGLQPLLGKWDALLEALVVEGRKAGGETRTAYERRLKELRLGRKAVQRSLEAASVANVSRAAQAQADLQAAWETIRESMPRTSSELRAMPRDGRTFPPAPLPLAESTPVSRAPSE